MMILLVGTSGTAGTNGTTGTIYIASGTSTSRTSTSCTTVTGLLVLLVVPYSTKLLRDKTFTVRSSCEYSQKNFRICIIKHPLMC